MSFCPLSCSPLFPLFTEAVSLNPFFLQGCSGNRLLIARTKRYGVPSISIYSQWAKTNVLENRREIVSKASCQRSGPPGIVDPGKCIAKSHRIGSQKQRELDPNVIQNWIAELCESVAKWQCCSLREATSAALPCTRRTGFWVAHESIRPVQPRSTQPQPPSPQPQPKRNPPTPPRRGGRRREALSRRR